MHRIYWIEAPPPGRIAVMPRPMPDRFPALKAAGIDVIVSCLQPEEAEQLGLGDEAGLARAVGMEFLSLPIEDHGVPAAVEPVVSVSGLIRQHLAGGKGVAVHCFAGLGRSPLTIAAALIDTGMAATQACELISHARGFRVPEMAEQARWLAAYERRQRRTG